MMQIVFIYLGEKIYTWAGENDVFQMITQSKEIIISERSYKFMHSELDFDNNEYRITLEYVRLNISL